MTNPNEFNSGICLRISQKISTTYIFFNLDFLKYLFFTGLFIAVINTGTNYFQRLTFVASFIDNSTILKSIFSNDQKRNYSLEKSHGKNAITLVYG